MSIFLLCFFFDVKAAYAHRPHDVIEQVLLSPSYAQDNTVYSFVRGNLFKSSDRGESWAKANPGLPTLKIEVLAVAPDSADRALAASSEGGLYRTENGGKTWETALDKTQKISAIAYFPDSPNRVAIGTLQGALSLSEDGGKTWKKATAIAGSGKISAIAPSPNFAKDGTFWAGTEKKDIWQTRDRGATFTPGGRIASGAIEAIVVSPDYAKDTTLFTATWNEAVYQSNDSGKTWTEYKQGITKDDQADVPKFSAPHFYDLAISPAFSTDKTLYLGGFDGMFASTDGGRAWKELETLSRGTIIGLAVSPNYQNDSTVAIANYVGNLYISRDKGTTWSNITTGLEVPRFTNNFKKPHQDPRRFFDIAFSPNYAKDKTLFASVLWTYFLKSTNDGKSWQLVKLPKSVRGVTIAVSPNFAADKTIFVTNQGGNVMKSEDGGNSFKTIAKVEKVKGNDPPSLAISPDFAADKTLYIYNSTNGISKSTDGGKTWQPAARGTELQKRSNLQIAISPNYKRDRTLFVGSNGGIFTTSDAGAGWKKLPGIEGYVQGVALSPDYARAPEGIREADRTLIASVRGKGLFQSSDGGATFRKIGNDSLALAKMVGPPSAPVPIKFSPDYARDRTLYGFGATTTKVFKSTDSGATWDIIAVPKVDNNRYDLMTRLQLIGMIYKKKILGLLIALALGVGGYLLLGELKPKKSQLQ
ncbi:YCF48-related protein [Oscillatoria sp. FACHB-1406]|uniref:WD40/YVTN/BNR-like repeat-containing protein n=1 Tax=Oscillatoria sp. FACHB-1406 TaxID=2692846 RepID=UPI0016888EF0|nr:YCF48-related protein [Oscillatoria sp. FACHB-1406]MBD2578287.1 glycosyl hydrolase [Oscillatoria sp. FACHB-1406]